MVLRFISSDETIRRDDWYAGTRKGIERSRPVYWHGYIRVGRWYVDPATHTVGFGTGLGGVRGSFSKKEGVYTITDVEEFEFRPM